MLVRVVLIFLDTFFYLTLNLVWVRYFRRSIFLVSCFNRASWYPRFSWLAGEFLKDLQNLGSIQLSIRKSGATDGQ
jgi:hypothetical protein